MGLRLPKSLPHQHTPQPQISLEKYPNYSTGRSPHMLETSTQNTEHYQEWVTSQNILRWQVERLNKTSQVDSYKERRESVSQQQRERNQLPQWDVNENVSKQKARGSWSLTHLRAPRQWGCIGPRCALATTQAPRQGKGQNRPVGSRDQQTQVRSTMWQAGDNRKQVGVTSHYLEPREFRKHLGK